MSKTNVLILACLACAWGGNLRGEEKIVATRIFAEPANVHFYVDGQRFTGPANFLWPAGSKHIVNVPPIQTGVLVRTRYRFSQWADSTGVLNLTEPTVAVTADPNITFVKAVFITEYAVSVSYYQCSDPPACSPPGTVYVNGMRYDGNAEIYVQAGGMVNAVAQPADGFVFNGWGPILGNNSQAFAISFPVNAPVTLTPMFAPARKVQILTSPPGLQLLIDRTLTTTPAVLDWGWNSTHTLGVVSPQVDQQSKEWVFQSWSDGGAAVHAYTVGSGGTQWETVTANFTPGVRVGFVTSPPGLKLKIDGRENWVAYNFIWGPGERHTVAAAPRQTDAQGRIWMFREWSNGGPVAQEITISEDDVATGVRRIAYYDAFGRVSVQTSPPGIALQVDGEECSAPCAVERAVGAQIRLAAPASVGLAEGARLDFERWSDGGAAAHVVTLTGDPRTLTASFQRMHRLAADSEPAEGAMLRLQPDSPDGFYDARAQVAVALESRPGFRFRNWEGDLSGGIPSGMVSMAAPRYVRGLLERIPYLPESGVRNGAAEELQESVAPGSVISIVGVNLAPYYQAGPASPLAQSLASVTVRSADRLLPLLFVSPEQINAQLPADLPEGVHALVVRWEGKPEARIQFSVTRNAPGLFTYRADERSFGMVSHADDTAVTLERPARRGEVLTALGTGFGPYDRTPPAGFAVPEGTMFQLLDPVEVLLGEIVMQPEYAGAAVHRVGVNAVRFRVPEDAPAGNVVLKVRVNGRESNPVLLPVE